MTDEKYIVTRVDDHEMRIRKLEENDIQQRIQLTNIEKSVINKILKNFFKTIHLYKKYVKK